MTRRQWQRVSAGLVALAAGVLSSGAHAQAGWLDPARWDLSGTLRMDTAFRLSNSENTVNERGNPYNNKEVQRAGALPGLPPLLFDSTTRNGPDLTPDNHLNLAQLRGEFSFDYRVMRNLELRVRGRAVHERADMMFSKFRASQIGSERIYESNEKVVYFAPESNMRNISRWHPFEWSGNDYMVDFPAFYLNWQQGPLNVRVGNQQIAWGQLIFFRILDQVQGLDLRRHSALDFAGEEFSDKRVSTPAIRATYQLGPWILEAFGQKFQPTIIPNANTPYNFLFSGFSVHNNYDDVRDKIDYGARARGVLGPFVIQAMAARRHEHLGQFRWVPDGHGFAKNAPAPIDLLPIDLPLTGALIFAPSAHYPDPAGVWSGEEWFYQAGAARLNGVTALNNSIDQVSDGHLRTFLARPCPDLQCAQRELDLFFQLFGPLTGNIEQNYHQGNVFGLGLGYTIETPSRPASIFNQMIVNVEAVYEPNRVFTDTGLSVNYLKEDDLTIGVVAETWHRWTPAFPGMYMVWQYMHRRKGDMFGRHLSGFGGDKNNVPTGIDSFNAVVFAFQQPSPSLVWRFDFAALYDIKGGLLLQPAVKWEPTKNWRVDAFVNFLEGSLHGKRTENIVSSLQDASGHELSFRIAYQF